MDGTIEEIRNHGDVARHRQLGVRRGAQAVGDRRNEVRLLNGEGDDLRVRAVVANQRDVGTVQCRDYPRSRAGARCREYLAREKRSGRMRYRVVGVNDVEMELTRDLHDSIRERQQVLRFAEQRVGWREHLVE
jgi:hypothetical protein